MSSTMQQYLGSSGPLARFPRPWTDGRTPIRATGHAPVAELLEGGLLSTFTSTRQRHRRGQPDDRRRRHRPRLAAVGDHGGEATPGSNTIDLPAGTYTLKLTGTANGGDARATSH